MSYRIGPVFLTNYGPYASARFDFSAPGLTCIEGEYIGHGCDSNGSGKTKLIAAVVWCIYGRTLDAKASKSDVVRLLFEQRAGQLEVVRDGNGEPVRPDEGCRVEVHLVGGPSPVKIVRYHGHPTLGNRVELYVDGKPETKGRDAMTQGAIEQLIGLDYHTFINSVAFGAGDDARSFFTATESERKAIMERVLGLSLYSEAEQVVRGWQRVKLRELEAAQAKLTTAREKLWLQKQTIEQVVSEEELTEKAWRLRLAETKTRCLVGHRRSLDARLTRAEEQLDTAETEAAKIQDDYEQSIRVFERKRTELQRSVREAERVIVSTDATMSALQSKLNRLDALAGKSCPECEQVLDVDRAREMRRRVVREYKALRLQRRTDQATILRTQEAELSALHAPTPPDHPIVAARRQRCGAVRSDIDAADARIDHANAHAHQLRQDLEQTTRRSASFVRELKQTRRGIRKLKVTIARIQRDADRLAFWVAGFGNGGIKSFLMESEIPHINKIATRYAQRLLGPGTKVQLSAIRTLKGGEQREEMSVSARIPGCTVSYASASKGQKKRLDLCLLLAFRDIVSTRSMKGFDQFFADELFDGLDETGEDFVVELLRELSRTRPVILVTHSPRLKSIGDQLITVRHEDGVSTVQHATKTMRERDTKRRAKNKPKGLRLVA